MGVAQLPGGTVGHEGHLTVKEIWAWQRFVTNPGEQHATPVDMPSTLILASCKYVGEKIIEVFSIAFMKRHCT